MSSTIFLIIALVTTGIFVIQFVLSIFFGDIDADVDVDADISSVVSFKGLTHFGIGFGWYMYLAGNTEIQSSTCGTRMYHLLQAKRQQIYCTDHPGRSHA